MKEQGDCGACWIFAATAVQEAMQAIKDDKPVVELSDQEAFDCAPVETPCDGGIMDNYWNWSRDEGGSHAASDYPSVYPWARY